MVQGWKWSRRRSHLPLISLIFMLLITVTVLFNEFRIHEYQPQDHNPHLQNTQNSSPVALDGFTTCSSTVEYNGGEVGWGRSDRHSPVSGGIKECDVFTGKWEFDNGSYPLYNESHCPYMSDQLACHKHGRPDLGYQYWRWQPNDCNLKRWSVTEIWEKLRGKRLMFVGDSLNRGQWISMVCLLQSVIPANKRSMSPNAHLTVFRAEEYNATIEFLWAPLLVDSNSDDPVNHRLGDRIIRPDSASRHLSKWENADILVFNTYLWWRQGPVKLLWSSEDNGVCEELDGVRAMELAMKTWAKWVDSNVNPLEKRVFFVTMSPTHMWSQEWNPESQGNCYNESNPIIQENYWGTGSDLQTMSIVEDILSRLGSKVTVLNITQLSEYRKDGHPSIYRKFWETLSPEQLSNPESYSDCIHWCLPGVPDVWNELLFHFL
ncbi:protein trichome birefringence-like 35 [Chenopodium quinoa]|uniref:protein trichome birefringence-like 35 n=1 Tax=Chenopodium quinoa TaxID=63459 RepID=UPI000B77EE3A|nr:protein trichome birefringence-like 35 [Chenopodium quinoa]XP_021744807.1 protein trichome birefringence-like 35 [Chenopodium quinoa]